MSVDVKQRCKAVLDLLDVKVKIFGCYLSEIENKRKIINHNFHGFTI